MSEWLVALFILSPLVAFGMWLGFNALMVKWHGLAALKATPELYRVFKPRAWSGAAPPREEDAPAP